jgi:hypothetical protein
MIKMWILRLKRFTHSQTPRIQKSCLWNAACMYVCKYVRVIAPERMFECYACSILKEFIHHRLVSVEHEHS